MVSKYFSKTLAAAGFSQLLFLPAWKRCTSTSTTVTAITGGSAGERLTLRKYHENSDIWSLGWQNEVSDCDAATRNNTVYAARGTALHRPMTNDTFFTLWAYAWDANNITQFASTYGPKSSLYVRKRSSPGVWGDWEQIYPPA